LILIPNLKTFIFSWFERRERKWMNSNSEERKSSFTLIKTTKGVILVLVSSFRWAEFILGLFSLKLALYGRFEPGKLFCFALIAGFHNFIKFFVAMDMFYNIFKVFFRLKYG